jgi:hypothetical protein
MQELPTISSRKLPKRESFLTSRRRSMLQNNDYSVNGLYETCDIVGLDMMDLPGNQRWSNPGAQRTFCRLALDSYKNAKAIDQTRSLFPDGFLRFPYSTEEAHLPFAPSPALFVDVNLENGIKEGPNH